MKKLLFTMLLLCISINLFALDIIPLEPLKENEFLRLKYDDILEIEKISDGKVEVYYSCESYWGAWVISDDRRKVLLYEDGMSTIYLLDGNTGTITYKGTVNHTSFPDGDFKYLITSRGVREDDMVNLCILDLETMEELYNFPWLSQKPICDKYGWISFQYYKPLDNNYDFEIYDYGEGPEAYACMLLNAETREWKEIIFPEPKKVRGKTGYECGWE